MVIKVWVGCEDDMCLSTSFLLSPSPADTSSQSLPSATQISTTPPGEFWSLYTHYLKNLHCCCDLISALFFQVSGPLCQSYFVSKYLRKLVLTTPLLESSFLMIRQAVESTPLNMIVIVSQGQLYERSYKNGWRGRGCL